MTRRRAFTLTALACMLLATAASAQMATGTYMGDDAVSRAITDLGFTPALVIVKSDGDQPAVLTTGSMPQGWSKEFAWTVFPSSDFIQSIDADGFTVGKSDRVNKKDRRYDWIAFESDPGRMVEGFYSGDWSDGRLVDIGFRPDNVMVIPNSDQQAFFRNDQMPDDYCLPFDDEGGASNLIESFTDSGFVVGGDVKINEDGTNYYYVAWRAKNIQTKSGTYWGNENDNRNIDDPGFQPAWVMVKGSSGHDGVHTTVPMGASGESLYFGHKNNDSNRIQDILPDGFQVGSDNDVNEEDVRFYWTAFGISTDFVVSQTVDRDTAFVGEQVVFTVTVENQGPDRSSGVQLTDLLPAGLGYVSHAATDGAYESGSGSWKMSRLEPGASAVLTLTAAVLGGTAGQTLTNVAAVTAFSGNDPDLLNNAASASVHVPPVADIGISGMVDDAAPATNQIVTLTLGARNMGPEAATTVAVDAPLPVGLEYVSHSENLGSYDPITERWSISTLGALSFATLQVQARVVSTTAGEVLDVPLTIGSAVYDPDESNNASSISMSVRGTDLELGMTVDDTAPAPGGLVRFTLTLDNAGPDDAGSVVVRDLLPEGLQHAWSGPSQGTYDPASGMWMVGTMADGASATLLIDADVTAVEAGPITNSASILLSSLPDSDPSDDVAEVTIDVQGNDIDVSLAVDDPTPDVGDVVTYTMTVENVGYMDATGLAVVDSIPAGLSFASAVPSQGAFDDGTGVWAIGDLARGSSCVLLLTATVDAGAGGLTLTDTAWLASVDQTDVDPANNIATAPVTVRAANLRLIKSVDDPAPVQNEQVTFTVLVTNAGPDAAAAVTVADTLPAGLAYVGSAADRGSYDPATGLWNVGSVAVGDTARLDMTVEVQLDVGGGDSAANTATIAAVGQEDPDLTDNEDTALLTQQSADLNLAGAVDDATPAAGDVVRITLTLRNDGPSDVHGVVVRDTLPAGLTYLGHDPAGFDYAAAAGLWAAGDLLSGEAVVLNIDAVVDAGASGLRLVDEAQIVVTDQADPDGTDNRAQVVFDVRAADLSLNWTFDTADPTVGDVVNARLELANDGPDELTTAVVTVVLPAGLTVDAASADAGTWDGAAYRWDLSGVPSDEAPGLDLALVVEPGTIGTVRTLEAEIATAVPGDPNPSAGPATADINVRGADLVLTKTANVEFADVGETILYTVTVDNAGPDVETGVSVRDTIPAGLTYAAHTPPAAAYDPVTGVWDIGTLQVDESAVLLVQTTLTSAAPGDAVLNSAEILGRSLADPDAANDADAVTVTVPAADLELSLSALPLDPSMDDEVVLALDVSNLGPQTATGLVLDLPLPAGLIFSDAADAGYDAATGRWVVGDLSAGAAGSLTLTAVTARGTAEDTIRISARVAEVDQGDPVDPDRTADAELVVQPDADLSVSLALSTTSADVGDTLTWTVGVTNLGPSPAPGVTVTDSLPVGAVLLDWDADTGMYDGAGRWDVGSMGSGETSELRLRTVLQAGTGGLDFAGAAAVEASGVADLAAVNNRAERLVHVNGADLVLETYVDVEAPGEGDDVNITLSAANLGPDAAHAVTVTDTLPSGLTYVSHTPPGESVSLGAGGAYTWDVGTVEGPTPRVLFVRTSVDAGTTGSLLRHGAVVASAEQEDPAPGNNTAGNAVAVAGTDLALALTAGVATAAEGDTLEYVLTLENLGPRDGTGIAVRDSLGEGLLFLDVDPAADYDAASGIWQVGELASGASAALIVRAVVDERTGGSSLLHVARVAELDQVDPAADNDEGAASVAVVLPDEGRVLVASTALPDVSVRPLADAVPVLAVDMVNWSVSNDTLMSLAVVNAAVGEGSPAQMDDSWDGVEIWRRDFDSWNRLPVDPAEFSSSEARFDDLDLVLTPGDTLRLELRGRAGAAARDGDRLALRLDSADALTFTRTVSVDASWPLATDAGVVVDGFVAAQAVRYGIASGSIAPGETGRTVLDVVLPADGYAPHTLNELQVVNFGSARSGDDIASVRAWLDDDDGVVTPGVDVDLGEMVWTGDRWRLAGLDRIVAPGGVRVLVVIDAAAGAAGGASVQFGVPVGGIEFDLAGDGPLDEPLRNSETLFVSGTDRLYLAAVVQPWRSAYADDGLHQVLHLTATNTFDAPRTITGLNLACEIDSPWSDDPAVLSGVVAQLLLREDEGDDGVPGTADPILAASSLSGGTAVLGGFDWTVPPATTRHLFVDARLSQDSAADGDNVSVTIASAVDVQLDSESVISGDWPLDGGGGLVVDGMLAARVLSEPTGTRTASPGAADLLALDVVVPANGHADDVLEAFDVAVQGTADDGDLAGLKLWRDGGDGRFDAGSGQGDDVVLAPLFPRFGRWSAQDLAEPVGTDGLRLYVGLDLADDADDTDVVSLAVPVGGIVYASDGDGPIDEAIVSGGAITISTSVLHVSLGTDLSEIVTGQDVEVRLTVSNVGGIPLHDVSPGSLEILGDGTLDMVAGPLPASLVLDVGASGDFVWTRRAASIGEVIVRAGASGLDVDESVVASLPVDAPAVRIAEPAPELRLAALSQLPFAVNGGQTDVNALVLGLRHPGDESSADVKLDSMVIRLEDAEGAPVNAGGVLSRILARIDGELLLARDIEPETGAVLTLRPDAAPLVRSFDERVLTIGLEVAEHAAGAEFRLVVDDGALQASDAVAGGVVGVLLDEGDFPVHSELTRVVEGAPALAVAAGEPGTPQASRGQTDVVLANWLLENPGVLDLGAGIQLGVVVVDVVDADGAPLTDPSTVVRSLDLWYDGARLVRRDLDEGSASTVVLPLDTPLPIAAGTTAGIEIRADLRDDAPVGGYGLAVAAGTAWDARDANSGVPVAVNVTPAPLVTTAVAVVHPADVVRFGGRDEGLDVLTGGAADQKVLELEIRHPGDEVTAAVSVDTLVVRCLDTRRRPMAASQVLERVRIRAGDRAVGATVATASPDGLLRIALDGVGCAPGGRTLLDVNVDVRAESLVDTFLVEVGLDDLRVFDANLRSVVAVTPDVGTGFPLSTGAMSIRVAADELVIAVSDLMPATVAALGGDVPAIRLDLTNTAAPASGDLAINSLHVRGRMSVDGPDKLAGLVGRFVAVIDDEVWGESEALAPGDTSAVITGPVGLVVPPGRTEEVEIRFELVEGVESGSLTVGLGLGDIDVTQPEGDLVTVRVLPADGQTFPFWTLPGTVTPPSLEESYANFPNPFAAGSEATSFVFALRSESTVDLRVYTPRGELVRTLLSAERRDVGLHQDVAWDGRNGRGDTVRNGVYIAEIVVRASDGGTTTLRRKVAVVR